jgi:DNA-binding transcriptional regulator LsrR (DeoR family)
MQMSGSEPRSERQLMAEISRMYYLKNASKMEIAERYSLSRFKVARLLAQALDQGVVTISIQGVAPVDLVASSQLSEHWGINAVVVNSGTGSDLEVRRFIGQATAEFLMDTVREGDTVGLAWGRTLRSMADYLTRLPKVSVVQLIGTVTSNLDDSPVELLRRTSLSTGGKAYPIIAPALVRDPVALAALKSNADVKSALDLFDHLNLAIISVGSWNPPDSQVRNVLPLEDRDGLDRHGVFAEAAGVYFDAEGRIVAQEFSAGYLSISAEQLRKVPRLVAAAGGTVKVEAVRAVIKSGMVTDLVTDHTMAEAGLRLDSISPDPNPDRR